MAHVFYFLKRRLVLACLLAVLALPVATPTLAAGQTYGSLGGGATGTEASWNSGGVAADVPNASWNTQPQTGSEVYASWNSGQPR